MKSNFVYFVSSLLLSDTSISVAHRFSLLQNWIVAGQAALAIESESTPTVAEVKAKIDAAVSLTRTQYSSIWMSLGQAGAGSANDAVIAFLTWGGLESSMLNFATYFELEPINTVAPAISGELKVDETLTCSTGTWSGMSSAFTYQWQRNTGSGFANIASETDNTLLLTETDEGANIRCVVTATNIVDSASANSNSVGPIAAADIGGASYIAPLADIVSVETKTACEPCQAKGLLKSE